MTREDNPRESLMELDGETFKNKFNHEPFMVGHHLADHPLFTLPRLVELARQLPEEHVKYTSGEVSVDQGLYKGPRTGLSIEDTIRQIESARSWMVLKFVENDPEYRDLLHQLLGEIGQHSEPLYPGMERRSGFIFVSSPGSTTPFHIDPEFNFLLQVRGSKIFHAWNESDRQVVAENDLEQNYVQGSGYHLPFHEDFNQRAQVFTLTPNAGLHVPVNAPHWVKVCDEVSISFSITFHTPWTEQREAIYGLNGRLRKMKINPVPFGQSPTGDKVKYNAMRALRRAQRLTGKDND